MNQLLQQGYTLIRQSPDLAIIVREELAGSLAPAGLDRFPEAAAIGNPGPAGGRAAVRRIEIDQGPPLVLKTYRRGGLAGRLLGDRYTGNSRAYDELQVCAAAAAAGLNVPLIQIFWVQQVSRFRFRFAAATREIPQAEDSFQALRRLEGKSERQQLLTAIATQIRGLHDAGINHPDLNLGNILIARDSGADRIHLIDFDRATLGDGPLARRERDTTLIRIYRSLVKLSLPDPPLLSAGERDFFLEAYWQNGSARHGSLCRRCRRELAFHRFWWLLAPPTGRNES